MTLAADVVLPLAYVEFTENASAGPGALNKPSLILAQMLLTGTATPGVPALISSGPQAALLFGAGSIAHLMAVAFLANHPTAELYVLAVDDAAGSARTQALTFGGPSTAAGTVFLRVAGQLVSVPVASGTSDAAIAAAVVGAVNARDSLPVTATNASEGVTFTAKHDGTIGNGIIFSLNARGTPEEDLPLGVTATFGATVPGATDPSPSLWINAMGDTPYDVIVCQYTASTFLDAIKAELARRWGPTVQVQGTAYASHSADPASGVSFVKARNDKHLSCRIFDAAKGWASMPGEYAASYAGVAALELAADPGRPLQTLPEAGVAVGTAENFADRNTLAKNGAVTTTALAGVSYIEAETLTYRTSPLGATDVSWGYVQVPALLQRVGRSIKARIESRYPRHKLARDGNNYPARVPVVTPQVLKGECVAECEDLQELGYLQDVAVWKNDIICEIDAWNPQRVNIGIPARLIEQLRVVSINIGFGG